MKLHTFYRDKQGTLSHDSNYKEKYPNDEG